MSGTAVAQQGGNTRDAAWARSMLAKANSAYGTFQVDAALLFLDSALMRRDLLTTAEVAGAHKLFGASHALVGHQDSARAHYTAALNLDATTSLDPTTFSATERAAFDDAKRTWMMMNLPPDSAAALQRNLGKGEVRIGSPAPEATFFVDGVEQGPIGRFANWVVPAGRPVRLSIRSKRCSTSWDSVVTVAVGTSVAIGRRMTQGCT